MTNNASKYVLGLAVAGIVAAAAPGLARTFGFTPGFVSDHGAVMLFVGVFLGGSAIALGLGRTVGADLPPAGEAGAATPIDPADAPRPSYAPLVAGVGATVAASGGALGPRYFIAGVLIAVVASVLWLYDTMRAEVLHPVDATNVDHRLIAPLALPVGAFALAITIAYSFSRVLLTVSETASWIVAFLVIPVLPWLAYGFWRIQRSRL